MDIVRKVLRRILRRTSDATALDALALALEKVGPGDVLLDCGANIGLITDRMARTGATVHAFEPDPVAFKVLQERFAAEQNVNVYNAAVSDREGTARLFLHESRSEDAVKSSVSSSLLETKTNLDRDNYVDVKCVRLSTFLEGIDAVSLMKMDIEGHEIEVINDLISSGTIRKIDQSFVELHDRKNPHLAEPTAALREKVEVLGIKMNLNWH